MHSPTITKVFKWHKKYLLERRAENVLAGQFGGLWSVHIKNDSVAALTHTGGSKTSSFVMETCLDYWDCYTLSAKQGLVKSGLIIETIMPACGTEVLVPAKREFSTSCVLAPLPPPKERILESFLRRMSKLYQAHAT